MGLQYSAGQLECPEDIPHALRPPPKAGEDGFGALSRRPVNGLVAHIRADEMAYRDSWYQTTSLDVPYALCIRPGANNPYNTSTCGLVAGDEESYSAFESTFDGVIEALHGEWGEGRRHVSAVSAATVGL